MSDERDTVEPAGFSPGARVVDSDDDPETRDTAVVVNTPPVPADAWTVGDQTVAEYPGNQRYDERAPVVVVVFRATLDAWRPEYDGPEPLPVSELHEAGVSHYTFPAPRLEAATDAATDAGDTAETDASDTAETSEGGDQGDTPEHPLDRLTRVLGNRNVERATADHDRGVVEVEKLGKTYTVDTDGTVDGSDRVARQLEEIADDVLTGSPEVTA